MINSGVIKPQIRTLAKMGLGCRGRGGVVVNVLGLYPDKLTSGEEDRILLAPDSDMAGA